MDPSALLNSLFTIIGAISTSSIWRSEAQVRLKWPLVETNDPVASVVLPFSSSPSTSALSSVASVTLDAIMAQLQRMDACHDYLIDEMCQMNTRVSCITRRQARMAGFANSPSLSLNASVDEDDASSSSDDEMMTS